MINSRYLYTSITFFVVSTKNTMCRYRLGHFLVIKSDHILSIGYIYLRSMSGRGPNGPNLPGSALRRGCGDFLVIVCRAV